MAPGQNPHQIVTRFEFARFSMYACGFSVFQMRQFNFKSFQKRFKSDLTKLFLCAATGLNKGFKVKS